MNSMFTRHSETLDASELTKKRKNMVLFDTIANSNNVCIKDGKVERVASYEHFNSIVDGFYNCKVKNATKQDTSGNYINEGCFNVWLDDDTDKMTMKNTSDYYLSHIDYDDDELQSDLYDHMSLRDGGLWPFTKQGICGGQIPNKFTFFKKNNPLGVSIYTKDVKRKFPLTNLN